MRPIKYFQSMRFVLYLCWTSLLVGTLLLLVSALGAHVGAAGPAALVKDINPGPANAIAIGDRRSLAGAGGQLFFFADNGTDGEALWKSDGSPAGTSLVADINPGGGSAGFGSLTSVNDHVFFSADDGVHGYEIWKSDGSAAGTTLLADINPGSATSFPEWLTNVNGTLFFTANGGASGRQLIRIGGERERAGNGERK